MNMQLSAHTRQRMGRGVAKEQRQIREDVLNSPLPVQLSRRLRGMCQLVSRSLSSSEAEL